QKSLFNKDNKKRLYLVVAVADISHQTTINLKKLSHYLNAPGLRFADATLLKHYLHVERGSVTPFGIMFDTSNTVAVLLDSMLFVNEFLGFHPLINTATTIITSQDLIKFLQATRNTYDIVDFAAI